MLTLGASGAGKAEPAYKAANAKPELSEVVYNKDSGSYFQYVLYPTGKEQSWVTVRQQAEHYTYKGIKGRLAIVPNQEVNDFLRRTFNPKSAVWIGLRYFCQYRKLMWVTGKILDRSSYRRWARKWYRNEASSCGESFKEAVYMPVYYTSVREGFRWQAVGWGKEFYGYFVEYPAEQE